MRSLSLISECCIVHHHFDRMRRHCHRSEEGRYARRLKLGYIQVHPPKVECQTVQIHIVQKPQQGRHFAEELYGNNLQRPGCISFHPSILECHILRKNFARKPQHRHHFGEARHDYTLQKPFWKDCLRQVSTRTQSLIDCLQYLQCTFHSVITWQFPDSANMFIVLCCSPIRRLNTSKNYVPTTWLIKNTSLKYIERVIHPTAEPKSHVFWKNLKLSFFDSDVAVNQTISWFVRNRDAREIWTTMAVVCSFWQWTTLRKHELVLFIFNHQISQLVSCFFRWF